MSYPFTDITYPKARKNFHCEWCCGTIPRGEVHTKYAGVWEGDFNSFRLHDECWEVIQSNNPEEGWSLGEGEKPERIQIMFPKPIGKLWCRLCKELIISRSVHDRQICRGGHFFVDGGPEYLRYGVLKEGVTSDHYKIVESPKKA